MWEMSLKTFDDAIFKQQALLLVWPDGQIVFAIFGHLERWKFAEKHTNCPKVGTQLCQIRNKP